MSIDSRQNWRTKELLHEGLPLLLRYPAMGDSHPPNKHFPDLVVVVHEFSKVLTNGLPEADYNDSLIDLDRDVRNAFEVKGLGKAVLVETFAGKRRYYIYVRVGINIEEVFSPCLRRYPGEKLSWSLRADPEWGFIRRYEEQFLND